MTASDGSAHDRLRRIVLDKALRHVAEPFTLRSGEQSNHFIDMKRGLASGADLRVACEALLAAAHDADIDFDAVGGLTMGADQFAHGMAVLGSVDWFVVRKERKGRGTDQLVEGAEIGEGRRVLLVDDIVTLGGSIQQAHEQVAATGAEVTGAMTVVDRGDVAGAYFAERGVPYVPLFTYTDLDIPPVGNRS